MRLDHKSLTEQRVDSVRKEFRPVEGQKQMRGWAPDWAGPTIGCYCPMCERYRELRDAVIIEKALKEGACST